MVSRGRKSLLSVALSAAVCTAATALVLGSGTAVANAEPTSVAQAKAQVDQIQAQVDDLEHKFEAATQARTAAEQRSAALAADLAAQKARVDALRGQAASFARASFQNAGVDTTTRLFTSGDPDTFLQQVTTVAKVDENINQLLQRFQAAQANLDDLKRAADAEAGKAADAAQQMSAATDEAKAKIAEQGSILDRLGAADRAAVTGAADAAPSSAVADAAKAVSAKAVTAGVPSGGSAAAQRAAEYALAQVGDAYVWGAEGPNAFDCSGLMVAAYRSAGISIQHSAIGLSGTGRSVAKSDLQPGDLIFWYSPVHHVGIYVGGGMMVHARNVNVGVVAQSVDSYIRAGGPYAGAKRIVG